MLADHHRLISFQGTVTLTQKIKVLTCPNLECLQAIEQVILTMVFPFEWIENIVGKRRKYWLSAFSPFPTMFSKAIFLKVALSIGRSPQHDFFNNKRYATSSKQKQMPNILSILFQQLHPGASLG